MIKTDITIEAKAQVVKSELPTLQFFGWGFSGDNLNAPFIMVSRTKAPPVPIKGLRLLWRIGAVKTDKPISTENLYEPNVGDVGQTDKGERIEVETVQYY